VASWEGREGGREEREGGREGGKRDEKEREEVIFLNCVSVTPFRVHSL